MTTATPAHDTPAQTPSQPIVAADPAFRLVRDHADRQSPSGIAARHGRQVAGDDPRGGHPDDVVVGHDRPAAGGGIDADGRGLTVNYPAVILAVVGLVLAHAANNLINDYFDMSQGVDTEGYVRALYAPHPVLSGWITRAALRNAILFLNVDRWRDHARAGRRQPQPLLVIGFALAGLFLSVFYVAPPFNLKRHGLGELGRIPDLGSADDRRHVLRRDRDRPGLGARLLAALCAGRDVRAVRQAHRQDRAGHRARHSDRAGDPWRAPGAPRRPGLMIAVLPADDADACSPAGSGRGFCCRSWRSRPWSSVLKVFNQPKPSEPPPWYPARGWPLWFVGFAFRHTRLAGGLLTLGLLVNCILPIKLPLPWL